jgi:sugar lactone lactonase YvrE
MTGETIAPRAIGSAAMRGRLLAIVVALAVPALAAVVAAAPAGAGLPNSYILPGNSVFPEGVTVRPGSNQFFVSSTGSGAIFRGTLNRARTSVFLPGGRDGRTTAIGVRATRDQVIVAGGTTGRIWIYDLDSKRLVRRYETGAGGIVNDIAIAPDGDIYVTDDMRPLLFRIPASHRKQPRRGAQRLQPFIRFSSAVAPPGTLGPNGIVAFGDRYLLTVTTGTGDLWRIDRRTKRVRKVDLGDENLLGGDGMARDGLTLYAVRRASEVAVVRLQSDLTRGRLTRSITSPTFRFPTTVAIAGNRLLVVNSQFRATNPVLPFTVSAVRR